MTIQNRLPLRVAAYVVLGQNHPLIIIYHTCENQIPSTAHFQNISIEINEFLTDLLYLVVIYLYLTSLLHLIYFQQTNSKLSLN